MHASSSLAEFMSKLDQGPRGVEDACIAVDQCASESSSILDLQQMMLTDEDLKVIAPKFQTVAKHVTTLNLFMNEYVALLLCVKAASERTNTVIHAKSPIGLQFYLRPLLSSPTWKF